MLPVPEAKKHTEPNTSLAQAPGELVSVVSLAYKRLSFTHLNMSLCNTGLNR